MCKATLAFVLVLLMVPSPAFAQGGASWIGFINVSRTAHLESVTPSTGLVRSSLTDWLREGRHERSRFEGAPRVESLRQSGKREQQPRSHGRGRIGRHPALTGALVGAGVGVLSATAMENELFCSGSDEDCLFYGGTRAFIGAGIGAGVGALVGWIAGLGNK